MSRRDWVYLLSLLVPFVAYDLSLKANDVVDSLSGDLGPAQVLDLVWSDVFFSLGYALFWIGLFAVARKGPVRWAVVFLFHATTVLIITVSACAYQYYKENGATLDYSTLVEWVPRLDRIEPILIREFSFWILLFAALLYAILGPWLATRVVERWRGWPRRTPSGAGGISFLDSVGLLLLALGFGSLSLLAGSTPAGTNTSLARTPFVDVVLTGIQEATTEEAGGQEATIEKTGGVQETSVEEADRSDATPVSENPAAHARLVETSRAEQRNVVLVHLESTRARSVTPYNEDSNTTPFLNELAKQSLLVEQAHVGSVPRSSMSSISVNCGIQPPPRSGPDEPGSMPVPCLANLLRDQGYDSAFFSSNADEYGDLATANWGYENVFAPSDPEVPARYQDPSMDTTRFAKTSHYGYEEDIMLKPSEEWLKEHKNAPFVAEYLMNTGHDEYNCLQTRYGSENFSNDDLLNHYLNCLRLQDIFLKNLVDQYKEQGLYENTIFVLFGDHGEGFGEHGRFMHGDTIWEEGLSVPLIIHAPGWFEDGERVRGLSNYTDILPTVVEMLGYEVKDGKYPGYSLLHPLPEDRTLNFVCISPLKCMASIKGDEKYIYHFDNQPEEVFDLSKDPQEEHNLADQYSKEDLDERRRALFAWLSRIDAEYGYGSLTWGDQSGEIPEQQTAQSGEQGPTVAVGQPLAVGDMEWTVTDAHPADQLVSPVDGSTRQGNFVIVDFQIKNNSNEGLDLSSQSLALFDGDGRRYPFDTNTYLYVDWSKVIFRFEVAPGDSQEGEVIFEVPSDASQFQLQLGGRNPFSNKSGYVNLGS